MLRAFRTGLKCEVAIHSTVSKTTELGGLAYPDYQLFKAWGVDDTPQVQLEVALEW